MKTTIIGGDFGTPKASGIIRKISEHFDQPSIINGGELNQLPTTISSDLILWMPNINNEQPKHYPKKGIGDVLICSKVMREEYSIADAVSRIFRMHGNAVIAIYKNDSIVAFKLIDALGNFWYNGSDISQLCIAIKEFYAFTKSAIRMNSNNVEMPIPEINDDINRFIDLNKKLSKHIQISCGQRFFGNLSTRCQKLFPTCKAENSGVFVSPRNVDKSEITSNDMVYVRLLNDAVIYAGDHKPSVDSPIQLLIYSKFPNINYMIHGHAFIEGAIETKTYCLCGDVREVDEVSSLITTKFGAINLKNHGFLIFADTLDNLANLVDTLTFSYRRQ